jgi:LSD1 subclass zinc finger protein
MNLHLVDGTYELFRQYYAVPSARGAGGGEVGAVRGLCRTLLSLVRGGATHIACAFDHVIESFRNDLFDGYKTGEGVDPALLAQFQLAEEATEALGFVCWSMVEYEADDALATAAARYRGDPRVDRIYLCSVDKDLMQCVRDRKVIVWDRRRDLEYDEAGVIDKLGVAPASVPDYLALVGDSADGIPGLPQWGAKSTARVLARYGHIEDIPARGEDWDVKVRGGARLAETLRARRADALLYRQLATLREDVPLVESIDDLAWRGADRERATALIETLADTNLARLIEKYRD